MPTRDDETLIHHGTPEFRRTNLALFVSGFTTFALLYCVQPLLPVFARDFHVGAAASSLSLSLTTGFLAPSMIVAGALSEARGRKPLMVASLVASALLTLLSAFMGAWGAFLVLRALAGIAFAGLPAITMAYLSEEMAPTSIGLAMGLSIAGNGLGGMVGRLFAAFVTDLSSWRIATAALGVFGLAAAWLFWRVLPPSRQFVPRAPDPRAMVRSFVGQLMRPAMAALFAEGFLLMGTFVTTYNYITYHLLAPPYALRPGAAGAIFAVYLVGIVSSAWIGFLSDRVGRGRMLPLMLLLVLAGIALTLARPLPLVVLGVAVVTFGFFGGHSVASSWVGLRAHNAKAQASALYLFSYYIGASVAGSLGGVFWAAYGWTGVVAFVASLAVLGLIMSRVALHE